MPNVSPNYTRLIVRGAIALSALLVVVVVIATVSPKPQTQTIPGDLASIENADSDGDGVINSVDVCPNTDPGEVVGPVHGCSDSDLRLDAPTAAGTSLDAIDLIAIEGETGTAFTEGGISISTSQPVAVSNFNVSAQSVEFVVSASTAGSVSFIVSGLTPNTIFFKHTRGHLNEVQLISNASGSVTFTETVSTEDLYLTLGVSSGTVTISASTTLVADITDFVVIDTSGVTLNCAGFTIGRTAGPPLAGVGLTINAGLTNVTVENCTFDNIDAEAIVAAGSNTNLIIRNNTFTRTGLATTSPAVLVISSNFVDITDNLCQTVSGGCFFLDPSDNAEILRNTIDDVNFVGITVVGGTNNLIATNTITNTGKSAGNFPAIVVDGSTFSIIEFNTSDITTDSTGILVINGSTDAQVRDNTLTNIDFDCIAIVGSDRPVVLRNTCSSPTANGIVLLNTDDGTVNKNNISGLQNTFVPDLTVGILLLDGSDRNTIGGPGATDGNTIDGGISHSAGISLQTDATDNVINFNNISNVLFGISIGDFSPFLVSDTTTTFNTISVTNSPVTGDIGIGIFGIASDLNTIKNNTVTSPGDGIVDQFDVDGKIISNIINGGVGFGISTFGSTMLIEDNTVTGFTGGVNLVCFLGTCIVKNNTVEPGVIIGPLVRAIAIISGVDSLVDNNIMDCAASTVGGGSCTGFQDQNSVRTIAIRNNVIQSTIGARIFSPDSLIFGANGLGNTIDAIDLDVKLNATIFPGTSTAIFQCNDFISGNDGFLFESNEPGDGPYFAFENRMISAESVRFTGGWNAGSRVFHNNFFSTIIAGGGTGVIGDASADLHNPSLNEGNHWDGAFPFIAGIHSNHPVGIDPITIDDPNSFATPSSWPGALNCTPSTIVPLAEEDVCDPETILTSSLLQLVPLQVTAGTFSYEPFIDVAAWEITVTGPGNVILNPDFQADIVQVETDTGTTGDVTFPDIIYRIDQSTIVEIASDGLRCELLVGSVEVENNSLVDVICLVAGQEVTIAPGQILLLTPVTDTDGDGVTDADDACVNTPGRIEFQGCPVGDENEVVLHTVDRTKTRCPGGAGSCKEPIVGAVVRVFDRNDSAFRTTYGTKNPSGTIYNQVFENDAGRVGTCTTDATGKCIAGEETIGDYLVIVKYVDQETSLIAYTGLPKSPSDFVDNLALKDFQYIKVVPKSGAVQDIFIRASGKTVVSGSELIIIDPLYVLWDGDTEIYPFLFISDSDWTIDVCLRVPQGYTILEGDCNQAFVSGETKDILFTVQRTGSPPPNFGVKFKARDPKGKLHVIDHDIPGLDIAAEKAPVELPERAQPRGVPFQAQAQAQPQEQKSGFLCRALGWVLPGLCR